MQGIYVNHRRPKSKKEVREAIARDPGSVQIEATSMFGNEFDGMASDMPDSAVAFVGPDPYTDRRFYGTLTRSGSTWKVV